MWVIVGPFDGEVGEMGIQKPKLLKPNTSYSLGRKDKDLIINNKKISHDHCDFVVGEYTIDDVSNPSAVPTLELLNRKKDKTIQITRAEEVIHAEPNIKAALEHGDRITVVSGAVAIVEWRPICAFYLPRTKPSIPVDVCTSLGIKLLHIPHKDVTHHLTSHFTANLSIATSLLSLSRIVKPEWLLEVLRLGGLAKNDEESPGTSLEDHFLLPQESKFRPSFSPSLLPSQKVFSVWEPNEERVNLFVPFRFICLHEKVTSTDTEVRDAIHRGVGNLETFDIHTGATKFHRALTRSQAKSGKTTVVVGDPDSMQSAVGKEEWGQIVSEAKSFGLDIISPSKIVQIILEVNTSLFQTSSDDANPSLNSSPLPDMVPNSLPDEPSIEPTTLESEPTAPKRKLVRRAQSKAASREPSVGPSASEPASQDNNEDEPRPRKALTRRVMGGKPVVTGLEDPSSVLDELPDLKRRTPPPAQPVTGLTAATPARSSRLKRRANLTGPDGLYGDSQMTSGIEETAEPPLKKFKALFEASEPSLMNSGSIDLTDAMEIGPSTQTQTQNESQTRTSRPPRSMGASNLTVLREEEEESVAAELLDTSAQRGAKRRLESVDEDAEMHVDDNAGTSNNVVAHGAKKRAIENVNAVERSDQATTTGTSKPPSMISAGGKQGAPVGKPDTDAAFLKAIASTKRGKKTEDAFDREFNKLKISKPELEQQEPEEEWAVLADFGDDSGLRGNFMVVVEMDLPQRGRNGLHTNLTNHSWDGVPNFKKFKKKVIGFQRSKVDLVISDENDYGMGSSYWRGGASQTQTRTQIPLVESQLGSQINSQSQAATSKSQPVYDLEDESQAAPILKSRKPPSRGGSAVPTKKTAPRTRSKPQAKNADAVDLFLDSDEDQPPVKEARNRRKEPEPEPEPDQTLKSSPEGRAPPPRRPTRSAKASSKPAKPGPVIVDDDSDDGAVFKGFKGKKSRRQS